MFELYVSVWVCSLDSGTQKSQKRASDPLKLELHAVVRCPTWVLGPEHMSLQEQYVFLADEPSLWHPQEYFYAGNTILTV